MVAPDSLRHNLRAYSDPRGGLSKHTPCRNHCRQYQQTATLLPARWRQGDQLWYRRRHGGLRLVGRQHRCRQARVAGLDAYARYPEAPSQSATSRAGRAGQSTGGAGSLSWWYAISHPWDERALEAWW